MRGFPDHPFQSEIGQAGFVFRIAATDIRMVASKPKLFEGFDLVQARLAFRLRASPRHPLEVVAALVDGDCMTRILDQRVEVLVVEFLPEVGQVDDVPEVIARQPPCELEMRVNIRGRDCGGVAAFSGIIADPLQRHLGLRWSDGSVGTEKLDSSCATIMSRVC